MSEPFYEKGLNFSCKRCSACCGSAPGFVYLSKRDLLALCKTLNMEIEPFVEKYCRWADYYGGATVLALKEKKNYDCILWENECSAYEGRPVQCYTYPFWTWMIADKQTWDECAADCPGMNSGKLWTKEEIERNSKEYSQNEPITKEETEALFSN